MGCVTTTALAGLVAMSMASMAKAEAVVKKPDDYRCYAVQVCDMGSGGCQLSSELIEIGKDSLFAFLDDGDVIILSHIDRSTSPALVTIDPCGQADITIHDLADDKRTRVLTYHATCSANSGRT